MSNRPLSDHLINILNEEDVTSSNTAQVLYYTATTEESMEENAREFASAINLLLGRVAINEDDIKLIVAQHKKESGLR